MSSTRPPHTTASPHSNSLPPHQPDRDLVRRWAEGDRRAGDRLIRRYHERLFHYFARVAYTLDPAELTQETLTQLCISVDSALSSHSDFRAYLFGIARNVLNQRLRHAYRRRKLDTKLHAQPSAEAHSPANLLATVHERIALMRALEQLPEERRALLQAFYWDDCTAVKLGRELGVPAGTVRSRLYNSKCRLRDLLDEEPEAAPSDPDELEVQLQRLLELWSLGPRAAEVTRS